MVLMFVKLYPMALHLGALHKGCLVERDGSIVSKKKLKKVDEIGNRSMDITILKFLSS